MSNWAGSVSGIIIITMLCLFFISVSRMTYVYSGAKEKVASIARNLTENYGDTRIIASDLGSGSDRGQGRSNPKHHKVYKKKR